MAERVGFEPTVPLGAHAFQACALSRSAISPEFGLAQPSSNSTPLVIPFDLILPMELAFFFVCPLVAAERPKIVAFRDWLLEQSHRA